MIAWTLEMLKIFWERPSHVLGRTKGYTRQCSSVLSAVLEYLTITRTLCTAAECADTPMY